MRLKSTLTYLVSIRHLYSFVGCWVLGVGCEKSICRCVGFKSN